MDLHPTPRYFDPVTQEFRIPRSLVPGDAVAIFLRDDAPPTVLRSPDELGRWLEREGMEVDVGDLPRQVVIYEMTLDQGRFRTIIPLHEDSCDSSRN